MLSKILAYLAKSRTKLSYHWSELWRSLLAFVRFLTTYADDLKSLSGTQTLIDELVELLELSLKSGEAYLPDAKSYDDLIYKVVESGEALEKFRDAYELSKPDENSPINTLVGVSKPFPEMINDRRSKVHIRPREVTKIIKQGYETLNIEAKEMPEQTQQYQELDHKTELKKIARVAVADAAAKVAGPDSA